MLLRRMTFEMSRAAKLRDPDSIHDLRVAIRRFQQCLRAFSQFFPRGESRRIRHRLRKIMKQAAEVRNRDVALEVLKEAGAPSDGKLTVRLAHQRQKAKCDLSGALRKWRGRDASRKLRFGLGL